VTIALQTAVGATEASGPRWKKGGRTRDSGRFRQHADNLRGTAIAAALFACTEAIMFGLSARGRITWILAIILGLILLIIGIVANIMFLIIAGAIILVFGVVFLILSLVTKGQTD
jgi:hypothetical protein